MCTMTLGVSKSESLFGLLFRVSNGENIEIFSHLQQFITVRTLLFCFVSFLPLQIYLRNIRVVQLQQNLIPFPLFHPRVRHIFDEGVGSLDEPFELVRQTYREKCLNKKRKEVNKNKMQFLTVPFITAISQIARWWLLQLVHVMSTTVSHFDHDAPSAAVVTPVEADLSVDHSIFLLGMFTLHPSRSVGTATLGGDTGVGYLGTGISNKLMPFSDCW